MVTFPDEFIGGLFQGMLNADAAALSYDSIQVFNRELNNLNDETVYKQALSGHILDL